MSWEHEDDIHAWWVELGAVLAGEYPGHKDPDRARAKLELLVDNGICTFLDLTEEGELEAYSAVVSEIAAKRGLDLRHHRFPIRDLGVLDNAGYRTIVDFIDSEVAVDRPVFVHCWGGVGRTGTVIGCWLIDHGIDRGMVLERIAELRARTRKESRRSPETATQAEAICGFGQIGT